MSERTERLFDDERPAGGSGRGGQQRIPMWKMALVAASLVLMVAGLGIRGYGQMRRGGGTEAKQASSSTNAKASQSGRSFLSNAAAGFKADDAPDATKKGDDATVQSLNGLEAWSPTMVRMGFSFFVGFAIAYVLRTFFKMVTFGVGLVLILLFGLQYVGMITVNWDVAQRYYNTAVTWLGVESNGLKQFVTAQLPSATLAGLGLVVGYRKG